MKSSIKDFSSKCDQIRRKLRIWSHLLKKFLMENFIFCAVLVVLYNCSGIAKIQRQMHVIANIIFRFVSKVIACKSAFSQGTINI